MSTPTPSKPIAENAPMRAESDEDALDGADSIP
jgi:hypothetical protein